MNVHTYIYAVILKDPTSAVIPVIVQIQTKEFVDSSSLNEFTLNWFVFWQRKKHLWAIPKFRCKYFKSSHSL